MHGTRTTFQASCLLRSCSLDPSHKVFMLMLVFPSSGPRNQTTSLHSGTDSTGKVKNSPAAKLKRVHRDNKVFLGNQIIWYLMTLQGKWISLLSPARSSGSIWKMEIHLSLLLPTSWFIKGSTDPNSLEVNGFSYWSETKLIFPRNRLVNTAEYNCGRKKSILINRL